MRQGIYHTSLESIKRCSFVLLCIIYLKDIWIGARESEDSYNPAIFLSSSLHLFLCSIVTYITDLMGFFLVSIEDDSFLLFLSALPPTCACVYMSVYLYICTRVCVDGEKKHFKVYKVLHHKEKVHSLRFPRRLEA